MDAIQFRGTVDDLIRALSQLPADVRARRVMVFDSGNVVEPISIEFWDDPADDNGPAVILDCGW